MFMQIRLLGDVSFKELKQALFEALGEIEDEYAIKYSAGCVLFINPADETGERVVARNRLGRQVTKVIKKGPYKSAAEDYCP